jgi:hypothetical protein
MGDYNAPQPSCGNIQDLGLAAQVAGPSTVETIHEAKDIATRYTPCRVLAMLTLSAWWGGAAAAETFFVTSSPRGNDSNDCSSATMACATFQRAVDLCPFGPECLILVAPGIYSQTTNVTHFKHVVISGPKDQRGACIDRGAVNVENRIEDGQQSGPIFWAQDHATLRISCMRLAARGRGRSAFLTRQFAIGDLDDVDFGAFVDGYGVGAGETSKISIGNPGIYGNARLFAAASDLSQVTVGGLVRMADGLKVDAFLASATSSVVSFYPSGMEGGAHFSGASYRCSDASIKKTVVLPGGDVPYQAADECKIIGVGSSNSSTLAAKIDDVQHAENVQRRLDRRIAATVVLVLVLAACAAYYRLATLKK